jgi:uncharacterized DUF497 family protein
MLSFVDVRYELNGISFVWNADKAQSNLSKHRVSFEQAAEAFFDPFLRVVDASPEEEARDALIGMDDRWNLLFVVHIEVEGDRFRIISARRAIPRERRIYES